MQSSETKIVRIFDIRKYCDMSYLCDAKLRTDDGCTFEIHRAILVRCSDYFRDMFSDINRNGTEFTIPGISGECLDNILCYVYTGHTRVTEKNVSDILMAADYLLLKDLHVEVKQIIKYNMTELNCLGILKAARQVSDKDIYQECFRFIQTRFERLMRCQKDELAALPLDIFRSFLSDRSLYVYNETTVWQAIVEWTQKDTPFRMRCVPELLLTLAGEEVGEELATEILHHEIISQNSLMKDLRSSGDFSSSLGVLLSFLRSYSNPSTQPYSHRIPLKLHIIWYHLIIWSRTRFKVVAKRRNYLYITYDENLDLWRKLAKVRFVPQFLIAIGPNIYLFNIGSNEACINIDLRVMGRVTMEHPRYNYTRYGVVAIDAYIYILGNVSEQETIVVEVYDTANNRWFDGVSIPDLLYGGSAVVEKKIYLVGNSPSYDRMMTQMFDPVTQQWSLLSPPKLNRELYALVVYHQKIYLVGGSTIGEKFSRSSSEVFDAATNLWRRLPDLPYAYGWTKALVLNDQIVLYELNYTLYNGSDNKCVRWNEEMECWEKFDKTYALKNMLFCSVDDLDTIRIITKQNRHPETKVEKSVLG